MNNNLAPCIIMTLQFLQVAFTNPFHILLHICNKQCLDVSKYNLNVCLCLSFPHQTAYTFLSILHDSYRGPGHCCQQHEQCQASNPQRCLCVVSFIYIYMDQGKVLRLGFQFMCVCRLHHTAQVIMSCFSKEGGYVQCKLCTCIH